MPSDRAERADLVAQEGGWVMAEQKPERDVGDWVTVTTPEGKLTATVVGKDCDPDGNPTRFLVSMFPTGRQISVDPEMVEAVDFSEEVPDVPAG